MPLPFAAQTEFANRGKLSGNWQSHFGSISPPRNKLVRFSSLVYNSLMRMSHLVFLS
jgi:hypothetical protein